MTEKKYFPITARKETHFSEGRGEEAFWLQWLLAASWNPEKSPSEFLIT